MGGQVDFEVRLQSDAVLPLGKIEGVVLAAEVAEEGVGRVGVEGQGEGWLRVG